MCACWGGSKQEDVGFEKDKKHLPNLLDTEGGHKEKKTEFAHPILAGKSQRTLLLRKTREFHGHSGRSFLSSAGTEGNVLFL